MAASLLVVLVTAQTVSASNSDELPRLPEPVSLAIQAEKLRMAVLEARDVNRVQQRVLGVGLAVAGTALATPAVVSLVDPQRTDQRATLAGADLVGGLLMMVSGVSILAGSNAATSVAPENALWLKLAKLHSLKDPELYLAEAESAFQVAVQRAAFVRRLTAVGLGALGVALGVFKGVVLGMTHATPTEVGLSQVQPSLMFGLGLLMFFGYQSPLEAAWESYLDDKNLAHPYVALRPAVSVTPQGLVVGLGGAF